MSILVTGGLGYIGSHISKLINQEDLIIIDNLSNSKINHKEFFPKSRVIIDEINKDSLNFIFKSYDVKKVIHLAGLKSVKESVDDPLKFYQNNVITTINLLESMDKFNINELIFSSSAAVYGNLYNSPLNEKLHTNSINPYGETKIINENMIINYANSNHNFSAIILRYFNPIGAHASFKMLDNSIDQASNLMTLIIDAIKNDKILYIYGNDYPTRDGTCIRDYIHVIDLAEIHLISLKHLTKFKGHEIFNIGMGNGLSVLELIEIFEKTNNVKIKYQFTERRPGDPSESYASNEKTTKVLNWTPKLSYTDMCRDAWYASNIQQ